MEDKNYDLKLNNIEYKKTKYPNLYKSILKTAKGYKYLMWIKIDNKIHNKIIGHSGADNLTDKKAKDKLDQIKISLEAGYTSTNKITLDRLFDLYYETLDTSKQWTYKKAYIYNHYIGTFKDKNIPPKKVTRKPTEEDQKRQKIFDKNKIGKKQIEKIREMDIQNILNKMNSQGLSPRTRKSVMEVLTPLFRFATTNKYLRDNPTDGITVKIPRSLSDKSPNIHPKFLKL